MTTCWPSNNRKSFIRLFICRCRHKIPVALKGEKGVSYVIYSMKHVPLEVTEKLD